LEAARLLGSGESADALHVRDLVIRVPHYRLHETDLETEARVLALLEARDVPGTPRNVRLLTGRRGAPLAFAYRYVRGRPSHLAHLRGAARERYARDFGRFLAALHGVPLSAARAAGLSAANHWRRTYTPLFEECESYLPPALNLELEQLVSQFAPLVARAPRVLVHGDISGMHTLVRPNGELAGVIDFGDTAIADPAIDFAGVLNHHSRALLRRALTYYGRPVDPEALQRAEFFIALVPLFTLRTAVLEEDEETVREAIVDLRRRVRRAVVRGPDGPYDASGAPNARG
jgi:aminoglycoside phosphotransferase (APT) family kinase protein